MEIEHVITVIADLLCFLFFVLVLGRSAWQHRRDQAAAVFLVLLVALGVRSLYALADEAVRLLLAIFPGGRLSSIEAIQGVWPVSGAALFLGTACCLHFFGLYPQPLPVLRRHPWLALLFYAPMGAMAAILLAEPFLPTASRQGWGGLFIGTRQAAPIVGAAALLGAFGLVLAAYLRARPGRARQGPRDLLLGLAAVLLLGGSVYLLPLLAGWTMPPGTLDLLEPLILLILLGTLALAIVRHRLFDVPLVLSIGLSHAAATLLLVFVYLIMVVGAVQLLGRPILASNPLLAAGFAMLVAVALNPLRLWLQQGVDRLFYRQGYNYRQVVRQFGQDLSQLHELPVLTQLILERIVNTWQLHSGALALRDEEGDPYQVRETVGLPEGCREIALGPDSGIARLLRRHGQPVEWTPAQEEGLEETERELLRGLGGQVLVPIQSRGRLIGWLHLGEKRSERRYSPEDLELLGTMADRAGVALENALLYERRRREVAALEVLNRISLAATAAEWDDLLEQIYREISRLVDAPNLAIALYDSAAQEFSYAFLVEDRVRRPPDKLPRWPGGQGLIGEIERTGEPIVARDYLAECARRGIGPAPQDVGRGNLAWMGVPLPAGSRVLGVMSISPSSPTTIYRAEDLRLLATIASQAAVVIERAGLRAREQQRVIELETLNEIGRAVSSSIRLDELLPAIARAVQRIVDAPNFAVILYDAARVEFSMTFHLQDGQMGRSEETRWHLGTGLVSAIVQSGEPIVTTDYQAECARRGIAGSGRQGKAWMGVPLISGDAVIGVLVASSFNPETVYTENDVRLLSTVAAQAATAVRNARLYEQTDAALARRVTELTALDEIARELNTALDLQHVLEVVLERAMAASGASAGAVAIRTPDGLGLQLPAIRGYPPEAERYRTAPWSIHSGLMGRAVRTNRPILVSDVRQDKDYADVCPGTLSELAVPITYAGQTIGVINLESDRRAAFDEEHLRFVQRLADHAAIAINNARLFRERERRITELAIFNEIGEALSAALDLDELLQIIHQQVGRLFDTTNFYIAAYDEETDEYEILLDTEERTRDMPTRYRVGAGLTGYIIRNRTPLRFRSAAQLEAFERMMGIEPIGQVARSWMGVPLIASDKLAGVMAIQNYDQEDQYGEQDQVLFSTIAAQAAIAIANARLFQHISEARDRLQAILNSTRDGIILVNEEGRVLMANPPIRQWTGLEQQEIVGQTLLAFLRRSTRGYHEARRSLVPELAHNIRTLRDRPMAHLRGSFAAPPSWSIQEVEWRILPVLDQSGQRIARILVLRDVTEEREAERTRRDLDSMIVHDLRGPLTVILGSLETIMEKDIGPLTEPQRAMLRLAQESAERMQGLVNTLLDIRRLEAGKMPLHFAPESLAAMAHAALDHVAPLARESGQTMALGVPPGLPPVHADAETLTRVLENLLTNAVKFSYPGGTVRVLAEVEGEYVHCRVVDRGMGIPKAELERIFEKFVQVSSPGKRRGTGLGLAFCRLAVEAHGGRIWAESEEGKGSTFHFTIPVWRE